MRTGPLTRRLDTLERRLAANRAADKARSDTAILDWLETFATSLTATHERVVLVTIEPGDAVEARTLRAAVRLAMDAMAEKDAGGASG